MTRLIQIVFLLLMLLIGMAFHVNNDAPVILDFGISTISVPHLSWVVVGAFAVGALLGIVVMLNKNLRLLSQIRRLQKQHDIASKEIVNLRAIPINDVP
jgi:uncharacterized integral membrane protein